MASVDRKNNKKFDKKSKDNKPKDSVKFKDNVKSKDNSKKTDTEKSAYEAQNDKLKEAILALGGTKGDIKYLENIDTEENENLITGADEKAEVCQFFSREIRKEKFF
jgi:hypothetical protein